ncbi:hypothetical protein [Streptomyces sp. NPDC090025]|uniref:hypothetical protein n=1 Tax=Streptomyces sp. NPDC090025 TaxID=3365922 RepID=UPI0038377324
MSGRPGARGLAAAALAAALALGAAACTSGGDSGQVRGLCGPAAASATGQALRAVLGTDEFTAKVETPDEDFVARMRKNLREREDRRSTVPTYLCGYFPEGSEERMVLDYAWNPADQRGQDSAERYGLNGATGVTGPLSAGLYVECTLPGDLAEPSRSAVLRADAALTIDRGRDLDEAAREQRLRYLYLMTRDVTEMLGCENKPLAKEPVVAPETKRSGS